MYCKRCGTGTLADAKFCPSCGSTLGKSHHNGADFLTKGEQNELYDVLSDTLRIAPDLLAWCDAKHKRKATVWRELSEICQASAAPLSQCMSDYQPLKNHPHIWVCHDTGISTYRCGLFQYTDTAVNYPAANPESIGPVVDFGWWDYYHDQVLDDRKQRLFRHGNRRRKEQIYLIHSIFSQHYGMLRDFQLQHFRQILEAMPERPLFVDYALTALRGEEMPENVSVVFPDRRESFDPHFHVGGAFTVMMMQNGNPIELHECNALGDSIYRTHFS